MAGHHLLEEFTINNRLPSLNEYIRECRASAVGANSKKKKREEEIQWAYYATAKRRKPIKEPCIICIEWHEKTQRRDVDNIQAAQKFILDAIVRAEVIPDDNRIYVKQVFNEVVDDTEDLVIVRIYSAQKKC